MKSIVEKALNDAFVAGKSKQTFDNFKKEWVKENESPEPASISQFIEEEAEKYANEKYYSHSNSRFENGLKDFTAGANLLSQKLAEKEEEIKRLTGLIDSAFSIGFNAPLGKLKERISDFKKENNLS